MNCGTIFFAILWFCVTVCQSDLQAGPDPWHYEDSRAPEKRNEVHLPPDLRTPTKTEKRTDNKYGYGEWWFKRLLTIVLKSGQLLYNEDGSTDISLQMKFDEDKWKLLDECLKSESTLSDDKFRRAVGYIEEGIYKPSITEKIVMAWSDYIQVYFTEYKTHITWLFGIFGALGIIIWLWKHVSHKHIILIIFTLLYIYEVFISYKEAEQQEFEKFVSAMNSCKWYFWTSECSLPQTDPLIFMKHMNPLKIAIRMFTSLISEPILAINSTVKISIHEITDGLWFPFDKIVYGLLIVVINISLIYLLVMIVFNFIFNIPFSLNFLGLISIGVKQNRRSLFSTHSEQQPVTGDTDRISGDRLDKFLKVCSLALTNVQNKPNTNVPTRNNIQLTNNTNIPKLRRSASAGRLPISSTEYQNYDKLVLNNNLRKRYGRGDGDH